jgi:hypothetical protein
MDRPDSRLHTDGIAQLAKNPTTANIIEAFTLLGKAGLNYSWGDFLYAKYHRKIPNNYMITVRRFQFPTGDNLFDPAAYDHKAEKVVQTDQPELARAVTWMGETIGNPLENYVSWTNKYVWKDVESEVQVMQSNSQGVQGSSILGVGTTGFGLGSAVSSVATLGSGTNTAQGRNTSASAGFDATKDTYPNYTEGPQNVIKKIVMQDQGLDFEQDFEVKFHYNLQAHGEINPKMAFIDILANMLVLTFNNAPFWGGASRWTGSGNFGSPMGDHALLASGDLGGFLKSVMSDAGGMMSGIFGDGGGGFSVDSVLGGLGDVGGDMLGGWLSENLNSPQAPQVMKAFLSGDPTGKWHVTVGNPLNPIVVMGNLILDDTKFRLHGPLGRDDFPTEMEVTLKFKHGRPRDKAGIETMFNAGRGRLYYAPEDGPDVLNDAGLEPKLNLGTVSDPHSRKGNGKRGGKKGNFWDNDPNQKFVSDYNLANLWGDTKDAADKAWVKIQNVKKNVTEG